MLFPPFSQCRAFLSPDNNSASPSPSAHRTFILFCEYTLLNSDRLGQVAREIDVETLHDSQPVGDELQGNDVEDALEHVDGVGYLDLLSLGGLELLVAWVADDDGLATTSDDCWFIMSVCGSLRDGGGGKTYLVDKRSSSS